MLVLKPLKKGTFSKTGMLDKAGGGCYKLKTSERKNSCLLIGSTALARLMAGISERVIRLQKLLHLQKRRDSWRVNSALWVTKCQTLLSE